MAAASARTSRLGLCGCSMRGKIAVVVAFSAGSIASGSSAGSLVPVASAEGEPLAASAGVAPLVELVASGGTVAASEVWGVAVPALASALAAAVGAAPLATALAAPAGAAVAVAGAVAVTGVAGSATATASRSRYPSRLPKAESFRPARSMETRIAMTAFATTATKPNNISFL